RTSERPHRRSVVVGRDGRTDGWSGGDRPGLPGNFDRMAGLKEKRAPVCPGDDLGGDRSWRGNGDFRDRCTGLAAALCSVGSTLLDRDYFADGITGTS